MPPALLTAALLSALPLLDGPAKPDEPAPKAEAPAADPAMAERYFQIVREYDAERSRAAEEAKKAPSMEEGRKILVRMMPDEILYAKRMVDLAETSPRDPAARDALIWAVAIYSRGLDQGVRAPFSWAIDLLVEYHADDPDVARLGLDMTSQVSRRRDAFLEGIFANAEGREAKGLARMALAEYLMLKAGAVANARSLPGRTTIHRISTEGGKRVDRPTPATPDQEGYRAGLRLLDPEAVRREAERLFKEVVAEYGDIPYVAGNRLILEGRLRAAMADPAQREGALKAAQRLAAPAKTLGQVAAAKLESIRPLTVGSTAPEIDAEGLDGRPMKLSDYRGKVIVLFFWASTVPASLEEVPHLRAMVERLRGRPFAVLGANGQGDKAAARRAIEAERMDWPQWITGPGGSIAVRYRVRGLPGVFVLDAKGTIRHAQVVGPALDRAVDDLLKEAEASTK